MVINVALNDDDRRRFYSRLKRDESTGCLLFTGWCDRDGYGHIAIKRRMVKTHRLAFLDGGGILTAEKPFVLHKCDNPGCCEFTHLFAGNNATNLEDMARKGRGLKSKLGRPFGATVCQGAYQSQVTINSKNCYLGRYPTWQEASAIAFLHKNLSLYPDLGVN